MGTRAEGLSRARGDGIREAELDENGIFPACWHQIKEGRSSSVPESPFSYPYHHSMFSQSLIALGRMGGWILLWLCQGDCRDTREHLPHHS